MSQKDEVLFSEQLVKKIKGENDAKREIDVKIEKIQTNEENKRIQISTNGKSTYWWVEQDFSAY